MATRNNQYFKKWSRRVQRGNFSVNGNDIYSYLKYESGVHRVQRIPKTETQGRVHTSAATVAVLPEAEDVDIQIKDSDLESMYLELEVLVVNQ